MCMCHINNLGEPSSNIYNYQLHADDWNYINNINNCDWVYNHLKRVVLIMCTLRVHALNGD